MNKDLINYLDNINLNYNIAITDEENLIYNNMNEESQKISEQLKNFLKKIYNDNKIIDYFNNQEKIEMYNLKTSENLITNKEKDIKPLELSKDLKYIINNLVFTKNNNIKILKYDNFNHYSLKCIIPINNDFFKGSLIVLTNETDITEEVKESFFRFCNGVFFITSHYINDGDYSQYKLF